MLTREPMLKQIKEVSPKVDTEFAFIGSVFLLAAVVVGLYLYLGVA